MVFAVLDPSPLTVCINCSFLHLSSVTANVVLLQTLLCKIQLQGLYYSSHHYPHGTHFSNFIGFLLNGGHSLSWLPLPTKSYTLVLRHICLNASIPTFLFTPCDKLVTDNCHQFIKLMVHLS